MVKFRDSSTAIWSVFSVPYLLENLFIYLLERGFTHVTELIGQRTVWGRWFSLFRMWASETEAGVQLRWQSLYLQCHLVSSSLCIFNTRLAPFIHLSPQCLRMSVWPQRQNEKISYSNYGFTSDLYQRSKGCTF